MAHRGYPLTSGRSIPLDGFKAEIEKRLDFLTILPDDPQQEDCDWTQLALCLALRVALGKCHETLDRLPEEESDVRTIQVYEAAQASFARSIVAGITEQLDNLPQGPRPPGPWITEHAFRSINGGRKCIVMLNLTTQEQCGESANNHDD